MSFLTNDSALVAHTLDTEVLPGSSVEMFNHGIKAVREGGARPYRNLDVQPTGVNIDITAMQLYGGHVFNGHATALRYLKIYDVSYPPTVSDTPKLTVPLVAQKQTDLFEMAAGMTFANGIGLRATTALADSDTGAPSTNDVIANLACSSVGGFVTSVVGTCADAAVAPTVS